MDTSPVPAQSIMGTNKYENALTVMLGLTGESVSDNQSTADTGTWFPALSCLCLQKCACDSFSG